MRRRRCDSSILPAQRRGVRAAMRDGAPIVAALLCWSTLVFLGGAASAQEMIDPQKEYNVKAVSLYAFGRYVTWPDSAFPDAASPFVIGVLENNPFGDALDRIAAKKTLNGRPIAIRQISSPSECSVCHILFVPRTVSPETEAQLLAEAVGKPVLLVGESPGFAARGGIINFYHSGSNVRFELNPDRSVACRLSLNAKLLSLGTKATTRQ